MTSHYGPSVDPENARINAIDGLAHLIYNDERYDRELTWSDAWNAARVVHDAGYVRVERGDAVDPVTSHYSASAK